MASSNFEVQCSSGEDDDINTWPLAMHEANKLVTTRARDVIADKICMLQGNGMLEACGQRGKRTTIKYIYMAMNKMNCSREVLNLQHLNSKETNSNNIKRIIGVKNKRLVEGLSYLSWQWEFKRQVKKSSR